MDRNPNILVCPLDWGIGHATRCVPIIHELISQGAQVIIGASGRPLAFLKYEFPGIEFIDFPGHSVSYPSHGKGMVFTMMRQFPDLLKATKKEQRTLNKLIEEYELDGIISDNRFGLHTNKIPCVFMSHQVFIKTHAHLSILEPLLLRLNLNYIKRFTEYWVPDYGDEPSVSGDLSHKKPLPGNGHFIGPLSRFAHLETAEKVNLPQNDFEYDVLVMLSGPEPQRSILEEKITKQLEKSKLHAAIIQGKPEAKDRSQGKSNPEIFSHLDTQTLYEKIKNSKVIICRSGYSTLMDLIVLGKKAILVPTPGQTEQEYLARYHMDKGRYCSVAQEKFDLDKALALVEDYSGFKLQFNSEALNVRIKHFLEMVKTNLS